MKPWGRPLAGPFPKLLRPVDAGTALGKEPRAVHVRERAR